LTPRSRSLPAQRCPAAVILAETRAKACVVTVTVT
jgi:hypothetical protein